MLSKKLNDGIKMKLKESSAYELGLPYFGKYSSGEAGLSRKKGSQLADQVRHHHKGKKTR